MDKKSEIKSEAVAAKTVPSQNKFVDFVKKYPIFLVLVAFIIFASIVSNKFLTADNILNVLRQVATNGLISIGMTYVILTGGIDISVGSVVGLASILFAGCFQPSGLTEPFSGIVGAINKIMPGGVGSLIVAALFVLIICGLLGYLNGLGVSKGKMPAFVMTMSTQVIIMGLALVVCDAKPLFLDQEYRDQINWLGSGRVLNIPNPVIVLVIACVIFIFILNRTVFGRYVRAIGGNIEAARVAGINVGKYQAITYIIPAVMAGLAGILISCRTATGEPLLGDGYELDAIASTVIGGTALEGGVGNLIGTVFGVLIIGIINNVMNLMNVSPYYQYIIKGLFIFLAVLIRTDRKKK